VAEGVETEEQYRTLKELGCDLVQGYYFSKPLPPEEFEKFLLEKKAQEAK
jgi:EAL domain-containing protein (putative c-di-GMP-specific phosphodiesterase class I)